MLIEQHAFQNCRQLEAICFSYNTKPTSVNIINADSIKDNCTIVVSDNQLEDWRNAQEYGNEDRVIKLSEYVEAKLTKSSFSKYAASIIYIEKAVSLLKKLCNDKVADVLRQLVDSIKEHVNVDAQQLEAVKELIDKKEKYTT